MTWNWEEENWPNFDWDKNKLVRAERLFLENAGINSGCFFHLPQEEIQLLSVDLLSDEALHTSEIEGELLNRDSVQSSIKKALGLHIGFTKSSPAEAGIAEMMVDLQRNWHTDLSEEMLFEWHRMIFNGRRDIADVGCYRTHAESMQIVSGPDYARKVHFEAPPSAIVPNEMAHFLKWYLDTSLQKNNEIGPLARAGIAHVWFESVHPFEDGNGRIGRAIAEKALAEPISQPMIIVLAKVLLKYRKQYYDALSTANRTLQITDWLLWFAAKVIEAQQYTKTIIEFVIAKTKLLDRVSDTINSRQEKALLRVLREGPEGFTGGLSAANYMAITGATIPTATRDLNDLVKKNVFIKKGEKKSTRYYLSIQFPEVKTVTIDDIL